MKGKHFFSKKGISRVMGNVVNETKKGFDQISHAPRNFVNEATKGANQVIDAAKNAAHETSKAMDKTGHAMEKIAKAPEKWVNQFARAMVKDKIDEAFEKKMLNAIDEVTKQLEERKSQDKAIIAQQIADKLKEASDDYKKLTGKETLEQIETEFTEALCAFAEAIHNCRFGFKESVEELLSLDSTHYIFHKFMEKQPLQLTLQNFADHKNSEALSILIPYFDKNVDSLSQENKVDYLHLKEYALNKMSLAERENYTHHFDLMIQIIASTASAGIIKLANNRIVILNIDPDNNNSTSLREPEKSDTINVVQQLGETKVDLDEQNEQGKTKLHLACENGQYDVVLQLLKSGAKFDLMDHEKLTPALAALRNDHFEIANLLVAFGDRSFVGTAFSALPTDLSNDLRPYKWRIKAIEEMITFADQHGCNSLHLAVRLNQLDSVRFLCQSHPVYINQQNDQGDTPLHTAASKGNIEAAKMLLEYGAKQDTKNKNECLPVHLAMEARNNVASLLLKTGNFNEEEIKNIKYKVTMMLHANAQKLYSENMFDLALETLGAEMDLGNSSCTNLIYHLAGGCYAGKKRWSFAIHQFNQVINFNPNFPDVYLQRGQAYYNWKNYLRALLDFNQAIKLNPDNDFTYYSRSQTHFNLNDFANAKTDIEEAIRINPKVNYYGDLLEQINNKIIECQAEKSFLSLNKLAKDKVDTEVAMQINPNGNDYSARLEEINNKIKESRNALHSVLALPSKEEVKKHSMSFRK